MGYNFMPMTDRDSKNAGVAAFPLPDDALKTLDETPKAPAFNPVADALARAQQAGDALIISALSNFVSMPRSTAVIANPVRYRTNVDCKGEQITLEIRAFTLRGLLDESEILSSTLDPAYVIFAGLFGRIPEPSELELLKNVIERPFWNHLLGTQEKGPALSSVAEFVHEFPDADPALAIQYFSARRKAAQAGDFSRPRGINEERAPWSALTEMISVHMENVAIGAAAAYLRRLFHSRQRQSSARQLAEDTLRFIRQEHDRHMNAFRTCYSLLIGHEANDAEASILERLGKIQIHHGSAGSNMVARYLATLHTREVSDLFIASQMALDSARHFGAIHDMSEFIDVLEKAPRQEHRNVIRQRVLQGGLPTFGHPEIAAAGRKNHIQADPRPAVYLDPLFAAIKDGRINLSPRQRERLGLMQQIYNIAFVEGVVKQGAEHHDEPLRLTPNTDFGAWCVQEALGIEEPDRTLLTYILRGFGWMMDVREQLQLKIIRPVIPTDPAVVPKSPVSEEGTIPEIVKRVHSSLAGGDPFHVAPPNK